MFLVICLHVWSHVVYVFMFVVNNGAFFLNMTLWGEHVRLNMSDGGGEGGGSVER